jgi:lipopolysaccharide/colanic/teichoic acid biosynthesis glycosyltransferase
MENQIIKGSGVSSSLRAASSSDNRNQVVVAKPTTYLMAKRSLDVVGAFVGLILLAPVFFIVAILVKCTSKGPMLFRQKRLGLGGELFFCYKFRTMIINAEEVLKNNPELMRAYEKDFKIKNDPRITPIGNFLRKSSLDEIPQLFNVLRGEMSLIGPRPIVPREIEKYHIYGDKVLSVKPGLSGLWQASGRSETSYDERIALDLEYVDRCDMLFDLKLICQTIVIVITKRGAM